MSTRLLALDLSSNVGVAWFAGRAAPEFDTVKLEGDLNFKLGQFRVWLEDQYAVDPFEALAWERPLLMSTDDIGLLELLIGLSSDCRSFVGKKWIVDKIAIPWRQVDVPTVKLALTGKSNASKEEMLYAARRVHGWNCHTHHEADAAGVGVIAYEQIFPKARS